LRLYIIVNHSVSAKRFIVDENNNLLVLKREDNNIHMPGIWEPLGGRLSLGENPFEGLKREVKEETGLNIEIKDPMTVRRFTRQDGQIVTMIAFFCKPLTKEVKLSDEHRDFKWINLNKECNDLEEFLGMDGFYWDEVEAYRKRFMN